MLAAENEKFKKTQAALEQDCDKLRMERDALNDALFTNSLAAAKTEDLLNARKSAHAQELAALKQTYEDDHDAKKDKLYAEKKRVWQDELQKLKGKVELAGEMLDKKDARVETIAATKRQRNNQKDYSEQEWAAWHKNKGNSEAQASKPNPKKP